MKSLLPLLLIAPALTTSCNSLPQEEVEALVTFREGEITRLNQLTMNLTMDVERLAAEITNIEVRIEGLKEDKARTMTEKAEVLTKIEETNEQIEENQDRLDDLLD